MRAWVNESLSGTKLQKCTTILACGILFLAPHKFANNVSAYVFSFFPTNAWNILTSAWPLSWVPLLCGALLVLALGANRDRIQVRDAWPVWTPILLALLACAPGWVFAVNGFVPYAFTLHVASWLAFAFALIIHLRACPKAKNVITATIFVSVTLLCLQVLIQYFFVLPATREYLQQQLALYGPEAVPPRMISLVSDNRPQANFAITNSLAAHFILVIPMFVALGNRWGRHVDPPETSKKILPIIMVALPLFCLYTTKSRAGILAFGGGIALAVLAFVMSSPAVRKRYGRIALTALVISPFALVGAYLALRSGRGASSMFARFDYWEHASKMFAEKPWTGVGLGEFFHNYLRLKPAATEITRQPHSMFFLFLSSCGILGGLAALALIASPALVWNQVRTGKIKTESNTIYFCSLAGIAAWLLHSQADFNVHIPATVLTMTALAILPLSLEAGNETPRAQGGRLATIVLVLLAVGCFAGVTRLDDDYHLAKLESLLDHRRMALAQGDFVVALEGAVPLAKKAAAAMPGCPLAWEKIGVAAMRERRYALAETAYRHVTATNPHFAAGHYRLAEALARQGKLDEAREAFMQGKAWHPNNPEMDEMEAKLYPDGDDK